MPSFRHCVSFNTAPRAAMPSQARAIFPSQAKRRVGGGKVGFYDANSLRRPQQPRNDTDKTFYRQSCLSPRLSPPTGHTSEADNTPHLAVPAKQATGLRNDRPPRSRLGRGTEFQAASFSTTSGGSVAVFNDKGGKYQSVEHTALANNFLTTTPNPLPNARDNPHQFQPSLYHP